MTIEQAIHHGIYKLTSSRLRSMDKERYIYILDCEFTKQLGAEDQSWCRVREYALSGFAVRNFYLNDQELRSTEWEPWEDPNKETRR
jgi:hypothetical protein